MNRIAVFTLLLVGCMAQDPGRTAVDSVGPEAAAATITEPDIRHRIGVLAHDSMRGRDTPSEELEEAARWIAAEWSAFGLEPGVDDGWMQRYPFPAERLDPQRVAFTAIADATRELAYGREFFARGGPSIPQRLGAVYVGTRITGQAGSLRDRAALVRFDAGPVRDRGDLGLPWAAERAIDATVERAVETGAEAVAFVLPAGVDRAAIRELAAREERVARTLGGAAARPFPLFFLTRTAGERLLAMAGLSPELLDRDDLDRPVPLAGLTLQLGAPVLTVEDARPPNVVGVLRGSDPALRDSYVVLTAHFDHEGVGRPDATGDSIYNGADDNGSGTSILIEVAEAFARLSPRPARSIVFLAVSGEEPGLLGSEWYSDHPTVPLDAIVANINIDMVGRNAPDSIVVIGQKYSTLGRTIHEVAARHPELGLTIAEDRWPEERFFFRSDHFNFVRKEIPALFFFAGTHEDYHQPGDELDEVDTDKVARLGRLVFYLIHAVADAPTAPEWDPERLREVRGMRR